MQPSRLPPARAVSNVNLWKIPLQLSLAGGALFGFLGVLLALPAAAVIGVLTKFALQQYLASPLYNEPDLPP